jgi:pyrroline-5-carboxylate reductase
VLYPDNAVARGLFDRVGDVLVAADEPGLDAFSAVTATFAAHLDYLNTITNWLTEHGVDHALATAYTMHVFGQLGQSLLDSPESLTALTTRYMTPGGINEQLMSDLRRAGIPDAVRQALDRVRDRLS